MIIPLEGQPSLFKDIDTGQIGNYRDFGPFEITADLRRKQSVSFRTAPGEVWILDRVSVIVHPWHEVIDPSIKVDVLVNCYLWLEGVPLYRIAEPLGRSGLEERIAKIEERLGIVPPPSGLSVPAFRKQLVNQNHCLQVKITGSADELMMLSERTRHFLLCLRGLRRAPVVA